MPGLYLFLHGLTVVAERPNDKFEIALPLVPGHVYKAGNWLAETTIERGNVLELQNVTTGAASIYKTGFLIDVPKAYPLTNRRRAATLVVPRPKEVLGLLRAKEAGRLMGNPAARLQTLAEVLIFVYDFSDENAVLLDEHYWQPSTVGGAISLHVIATSEVMEGQKHEDETADALQEVFVNFPGIEYSHSVPPPLVAAWEDPTNQPDFGDLHDKRTAPNSTRRASGAHVIEQTNDFAFALAELEHPASRMQRLDRLGRMHREKRRIEGLWCRPDPIDGRASPCGSVSSGD